MVSVQVSIAIAVVVAEVVIEAVIQMQQLQQQYSNTHGMTDEGIQAQLYAATVHTTGQYAAVQTEQ